MSTPRRFHQIDVFTAIPLKGNALAVVHDATGLDDKSMGAFARWTNLSETTFLLPPSHPDADYRVRIFTPEGELPFAGHPTLGSCFAWLQAGGKPRSSSIVVQECPVGLVKIRRNGTRLAFAAPPLLRTGDLDESTLFQVAASLGIGRNEIVRHQWVDNGPGWCVVMLNTAEQVRQLKPDFGRMGSLALGVIGRQPEGSETDFEIRAFVPSLSVPEDPVTGSLNAGVAQWMMREGLAPEHYVVAQGTLLQRNGRVYLDKIEEEIWVGGDVVICIEGHVAL
jgi:PhzF family phenazine biosynthesis protein